MNPDEEKARQKKPGETDLQWRLRIAELDLDRRSEKGPLITPETERQGDYQDGFVMHIETQTLAKTLRNHMATPIYALFERGSTTGEMVRDRSKLEFIVTAREKKQWIA